MRAETRHNSPLWFYAGIRREEAVAFPVFCPRAQDRLVNALLKGFEPPLVCESLRGVKGRESLRK